MAPPSSWSDIPLELAGLVLRRLPANVDRVRFAAVCPQWRAAAREVTLPSPLPLLALPDGTVYSLPGSEPLRFPGCTGYADACGNWLAFSTEEGCFLSDPFSNATVTLPQLSRLQAPCHRGGKLVSWIEIEEPPEKLTMYKPVFCSRQLIAIFITYQYSTKVAVCQPGAASWWSVHVDHRFELTDDMAFHQGKLYILNDDDHSLFAMDISVDHRTGAPWICQVRRVISGVLIPRPAVRGICRNEHQKMLYLVESESHGTLLMIHRKTYGQGRIGPRWLVAGTFVASGWEFEVFMADFQQSKWTKVMTIGDDQVLFLRRRCSRFIRVSPEDMQGDRIIFLDRDDEDHDWYDHGGSSSDSCKVCDMRDGTVSPFVPSVHFERRSVPATWLFPQV
jgi:hypothetical protein